MTVREAIDATRADGRQRSARCPAHHDERASLSIGRGEDGRVLLRCMAGCTIEAVLAALAISMADLFPPRGANGRREIVAVYRYHDERGELLFEVVRLRPKDFRQRRPDGRGGWIWNVRGVRRVLYRLPEIAGHSRVFITEGEKDVDRLWSIGLTATTNVGGAGKWRDEYSRQLHAAGVREVVILPDNDDAGRQHAEQVARSCSSVGISVQIVALPDLPAKGDVSDWLDGGHTRDDLLALVAAAPTSSSAPRRTPILTVLADVTPEQVAWIWPGRLARGKYTLLAGEPGVGKTWLALDAAARITTGRPWPDGAPAPHGRVLILSAEDGKADTLRPRVDAAGGDSQLVTVLDGVCEPDGTRSPISLARDIDVVGAAIAQVQPVLVVVDPITAYLGRVDTHRDSEVRSVLAPLLDLVARAGCALLAIGHLSKDAQRAALHRPSGSIAFVAAARIVLALAADPQTPERRVLCPLKANLGRAPQLLAYHISDDAGLRWEAGAVRDVTPETLFRRATPEEQEQQTDAESFLRELLDDVSSWPLDARHVIAAAKARGINERTLRRSAQRMGIRTQRVDFGARGRWLWHRPHTGHGADTDPPEHHNVSSMAAMPNPSTKGTKQNIEDTDKAFSRARARTTRPMDVDVI